MLSTASGASLPMLPVGSSPVGGHGRQEDPQVFARVAEGAQLATPLFGATARAGRPGAAACARSILLPSSHWRVRLLRRDLVLDLVVADDAAAHEVDEEHAAGLEPALLDDVLRLEVERPRARSPRRRSRWP